MSKELVRNWMTEKIVTVLPNLTLPEAHELMTREEIRRLLVVVPTPDWANGRLVGIVTLGDIREAEPSSATSLTIWELNHLIGQLTMQEIMTVNPITVRDDQTIGEAARIMLERRVSGLPVLNANDQLVGVITESDIFSMVVLHEWGVGRFAAKES